MHHHDAGHARLRFAPFANVVLMRADLQKAAVAGAYWLIHESILVE
jgi:hypothetical protein